MRAKMGHPGCWDRLESAAIFEGAGDGDLVGVLDVGAGGDAGGDARDGEGGELAVGFVGEVVGGGFAFDGGGCGEDEFGLIRCRRQIRRSFALLRMTAETLIVCYEGGEAGPEVGEAEL